MDVGDAKGLLHTVRGLVHGGLPLEDALLPVTATPAALFRLGGKGRIAVGADADLVALRAGDLALQHVLARGEPWVRDGVVVRRGPFET